MLHLHSLLRTILTLLTQQCRKPNIPLNPPLQRLILRRNPIRPEDLIHLLQRPPLCLRNEENDIHHGEGGDAAEENESAVVGGFDEGGCEEADGEVVELVGLVCICLKGGGWTGVGLTQLLLPPMLTPLARMLRGKTSDTTIHETGPELIVISNVCSMQDIQKSHPTNTQN